MAIKMKSMRNERRLVLTALRATDESLLAVLKVIVDEKLKFNKPPHLHYGDHELVSVTQSFVMQSASRTGGMLLLRQIAGEMSSCELS